MSVRGKAKKLIKNGLNRLSIIHNHQYFRKLIKNNRKELEGRNQLMQHLDGERVLILAPHVDDETIGCGGAILQYSSTKKNVTIAFMTDSSKRGLTKTGKSISDTRKDEAREAARSLGVKEEQIIFLDGKDGDLKNSLNPEKINQIMKRTAPDTILLPAPMDTHSDHRAVSELLLKWAEVYPEDFNMLKHQVIVYLYDVQSPMTQFYSNITLDITNEYKKKSDVLGVYRSQGSVMDFGATMDKYYGILYGIPAAEVYLKLSLIKYISTTKIHMDEFMNGSKCLVKNESEIKLKKSFVTSMMSKKSLNYYHNK